ncbi:acyltransferase family protein [Citrobacter koseri]|uniref:acyltransferase family protein n=1 Tax=Citrobacter koseri TaxID=545 RepID=UPI001F427921|nr:acyltransferase [Citrobacter koseri]
MPSSRNHFFDILRLLSVIFVITSHYAYMFDNSTLLTFPRHYLTGGVGRLGVSFFFIISGALAYLSLRRYSVREFYLKRICSVLVPYNIVYFTVAFLLLVLAEWFTIPRNPLSGVIRGDRSILSLIPSVLGFDHYLHGVYGLNTAWLTGEWFIGCIILLYAVAPVIYWCVIRFPVLSMLSAVIFTFLIYDRNQDNPYWSAQVRISDLTFGMLFIHLHTWFIRNRRITTSVSVLLIAGGVVLARAIQLPVREVWFPLHPISLLFAVTFFFLLQTAYSLAYPLFNRFQFMLSDLASRAYIIMLIQHVAIIVVSANVDMSTLHSGQAALWYVVVLIVVERLSYLIKPIANKAEQMLIRRKR